MIELVQTMRVEPDRDHAGGTYAYTVRAGSLVLTVNDGNLSPWLEGGPGDRVVDVAGRPGILEELGDGGSQLTGQPEPDSHATLTGDVDAEELIVIAETVGPVPAVSRAG